MPTATLIGLGLVPVLLLAACGEDSGSAMDELRAAADDGDLDGAAAAADALRASLAG